MAGEEDSLRNLGAGGSRSAPPEKEKVEAEGVEVKVGVVPSAFMPQPLLGRHKQRGKKADLTLRPCGGSHAHTEESADLEHGGLRACSGILAEKKNKEEHAVTDAKRKVEDSLCAATGGSSEGKPAAAAAAAADASLEAVADASVEAAASDGEGEYSEVKWVEMPERHVHWILAQKEENHTVPPIEDYDLYRTEDDVKSTVFSQKNIDEKRELFTSLHASLQASHDDFFEYQAWIRKVYERNGRVLVPEACSKDELQKEIDDVWTQFKEEYARDHPDDSDTENEEDYAMVADHSVKASN